MSTNQSPEIRELPSTERRPLLIGIHGSAGSGKDTITQYLHIRNGVARTAFADPLKAACAAAFGIEHSDFHNPRRKEISNDFWKVSPREILQFVGTELFRDQMKKFLGEVGESFWIHRMEKTIRDRPPYVSMICIPDVRFQNEYDFIVNQGGHVIHLTRPSANGKVGIHNHRSEATIDLWNPSRNHHIFNGGTIEELKVKVDEVFKAIKSYPRTI